MSPLVRAVGVGNVADPVATTAGLRTLGTGAQQAAAGNHSHASGGGGYVFSADNTGATDVSVTLKTQANAAAAAGQPLIIPPGDYLITDAPYPLPDGVTMWAPTRGARFVANRVGNILWVSPGMTLRGLTFRNSGTTSPAKILDFDEDATDVLIEDCRFEGALTGDGVSSEGQGIVINWPGCRDITIRNCSLDTLAYAILTNTGANDLVGLTVDGCTFTNITGDAIEFNHPSSSSPAVRGLRVTNNRISVPNYAGASVNSGFGIGMAGCRDVTIANNTILECRREGVHVEDDCHAVTITGNTIKNVLGSGTTNGIGIYPGCSDITISGNICETIVGSGIRTIYDTSTVLVSNVTITNNVVRDVTVDGIYIAGDHGEGGRFIVANNLVYDVDYGISVLGDMDECIVHDNLIHTCTHDGIWTDGGGSTGKIRSYRGNVISNCGDADYRASTGGSALILPDRMAVVPESAASVGTDVTAPLMRLGRSADGLLSFQARRIGQSSTRIDATWRVRWNGTTLVAHPLSSLATSGTISITALRMINGKLTAIVGVGGAGITIECSATFEGMIVERGDAYTGTVNPTAMAVTGSRGGNAALASLLTTLAAGGFITDGTSA